MPVANRQYMITGDSEQEVREAYSRLFSREPETIRQLRQPRRWMLGFVTQEEFTTAQTQMSKAQGQGAL